MPKLPKLPKIVGKGDELLLWLLLFWSKTEEDVIKIQKMGVPVMEQVIEAYRSVTASDEFKEIERLRSKARHDEASALNNAQRKGVFKGRQEKAIEIAKIMKARRMDLNEIMEITKLSVDDILRL